MFIGNRTIIVLFIALILGSCTKENYTEPGDDSPVMLSFKITEGATGMKSTVNCAWDVDYAMVILSHREGRRRVSENFFTPTYIIDDVLYTEPLTLPGLPRYVYYRVEECILYSDDDTSQNNPLGDKVISAAPHEGSNFGYRIPNPLNLQFEIDASNAIDVGLSVFCFEGADPADFGFVLFQPEVVIVNNKWFFCENLLDEEGQVFLIDVYRDDNLDDHFESDEQIGYFSNESTIAAGNMPISILYYDGKSLENHYELRFSAYLPKGDGFSFIPLGSLYFEENQSDLYYNKLTERAAFEPAIQPGADNVYEFSIGASIPGSWDFWFPAYLNLPDGAEMSFDYTVERDYQDFRMDVSLDAFSVIDISDNLQVLDDGSDDGFVIIEGIVGGFSCDMSPADNESTPTMRIGSSLYPALLPSRFAGRQWTRINYLLNHLDDFPGHTWDDVQQVIWMAMANFDNDPLTNDVPVPNYLGDNDALGLSQISLIGLDMYQDMVDHGGDFWPVKGSRIAILLSDNANPDSQNAKLIFVYLE